MIYYLINHINPPSRTPTPSPRISPHNSSLFDNDMLEYSRASKSDNLNSIDTSFPYDNSPFYNNSSMNSPIIKNTSSLNKNNNANSTVNSPEKSNNNANNNNFSPINNDNNNIYASFPFIAWTTISISVISLIGFYAFKKK